MTLAKEGDPYISGSGTLIEPDNLPDEEIIAVSEERRALPKISTILPQKDLGLDYLPEPDYKQQTVLAAVVGLKLMGVNAVNIAEIMDTDLETIERLTNSPATQKSFEYIFRNIIDSNSTAIQGRIAAYANGAVDTVKELMEDKDVRDDVRLKAAQDVLDRSGTNADQFFATNNETSQQDDELRIVVMDEQGENERVRVDIKKGK